MNTHKPTPWYRRLVAIAEIAGDRDQQDIARRLGVSKSTVTAWKNGTAPKAQVVIAAARAYGCDELELMGVAFLEEDAGARNRRRDGAAERLNPPEF